MTSAGGIDGEADILANMKIYLFPFFFSPTPLSLPPSSCCFSSLIRKGVLTSPAAKVWPTGWLGALKALLGMHCSWVYVYVLYCLHHSFCRLGEGCASDKGCWLSLADPCGPFTSCQSHGPQRGALPSVLPQPWLTQQGAGSGWGRGATRAWGWGWVWEGRFHLHESNTKSVRTRRDSVAG